MFVFQQFSVIIVIITVNPLTMDTKGAIESVHIYGVFMLIL